MTCPGEKLQLEVWQVRLDCRIKKCSSCHLGSPPIQLEGLQDMCCIKIKHACWFSIGLIGPGLGPGAWRLCGGLEGIKPPTLGPHFVINQLPLIVQPCTIPFSFGVTMDKGSTLPRCMCAQEGLSTVWRNTKGLILWARAVAP